MTGPPRPDIFYKPRPRSRVEARRSRRRRALAWVGRAVLAGLVFFLGVALGRAVEERPRPGGTQTLVRTLAPETLPPITRTVTVTTTGP